MACLAQLVNVIAPIRTLDGGPAWRQTTFFPFRDAARHGRGTVLRVEPEGPTYPTEGDDAVPVLEATAVQGGDTLTLFAVNRDTEPLELSAVLRCAASVLEHSVLADEDPRRPTPPKRPSGSARACSPARGSTASGCARRCRRGPGTCCACASEARLTVASLPTAGP